MQQPTEIRTPADSGSTTSNFDPLGWGDNSSFEEREPIPSSASSSFAGLLAALTEPAQPAGIPANESLSSKQKPASSWNDNDLADDVAILSYESALKAHARYRPSQLSDRSLTQPANAEPYCYEEASSDLSTAAQQPVSRHIQGQEPASTPAPDFTSGIGFLRTAPVERNLKESSITIRMSKAECAQLHRRAAEAGLTVSAYLRSCTFEAESLRAMVKDTMAQLRTVTTQAKSADAAPSRFSRIARWLRSLLTPWHSSQRIARA